MNITRFVVLSTLVAFGAGCDPEEPNGVWNTRGTKPTGPAEIEDNNAWEVAYLTRANVPDAWVEHASVVQRPERSACVSAMECQSGICERSWAATANVELWVNLPEKSATDFRASESVAISFPIYVRGRARELDVVYTRASSNGWTWEASARADDHAKGMQPWASRIACNGFLRFDETGSLPAQRSVTCVIDRDGDEHVFALQLGQERLPKDNVGGTTQRAGDFALLRLWQDGLAEAMRCR